MNEPTVQIGSNEMFFFEKGDQFPREKCLYLKKSGISCKNFQRVHPQPFLANFQFFEEIYYRSTFYLL